MKILFITTDWNTPYRQATGEYGGIGYYRAYMPSKYLKERGHDVTVLGSDIKKYIDNKDVFGSYKKLFKDYDAVVVKSIDSKIAGIVIGAAKEIGTPIAMDLDDNMLDVDKSNPAYEGGYKEEGVKRAFAASALSMCDAVFVSTQPLKDTYSKFLKESMELDTPITVLPNCIVPGHWQGNSMVTKNMTIIGWHGSITHNEDLKIAIPAINNLMTKYPSLGFQMVGGVNKESADELLRLFNPLNHERISIIGGTPSWKGFPKLIMSLPWDIGIAPLENTKFTCSKSHIKWMEYSLKGIPCVASDVFPYKEDIHSVKTIEDGVTGLLAKDDEWEDKLESLIKSNALRRSIGKQSKEFVKNNWKYQQHIDLWIDALEKLIEMGGE